MDFDLSIHLQQDCILTSFEEITFAQKITSLINTQGGKLIIGINSKGKIKGVFPQEELENIPIVIANYCSESFDYSSEIIETESKLLIVISVPYQKKVAALTTENTFEYYHRIGQSIRIASKIITKCWRYEKTQSPTPPGTNEEISQIYNIAHNQSLSQIYRHSNFPKTKIDIIIAWLLFQHKLRPDLHDNHVIYQHLP